MATRLPLAAPVAPAPAAGDERCEPDDRFLDYILSPYSPRGPHLGKLRAVNALFAAFDAAGVGARGRALVDHVRATLGPFRTVFGVKHRPGAEHEIGFELYFYDFGRVHADLSIASVAAMLAPFARVDAVEPWDLPWLMLSVEIGVPELARAAPARLSVYCDLRSYSVRGEAWELENLYTFHDPARDVDGVLHRLKSLVHLDAVRENLARVLHPDFALAHRVCVANKRRADAVYASRIPTAAASRFFARHAWPEPVQRFFRDRAPELDHLLWDVGLDFCGTAGPLRFVKSSFYGSF